MILHEIINGRYEKLRPTIVISNLAKEPLIEYLGERIVVDPCASATAEWSSSTGPTTDASRPKEAFMSNHSIIAYTLRKVDPMSTSELAKELGMAVQSLRSAVGARNVGKCHVAGWRI
jgi:hypothetical protein